MANAYKYDQLNRIAQSNSFTNFDVANNKWMFGGAMANMYKTSYTYDANGNIKNLQRYNAAGVKFDDMDYKYDVQGSNLISNKLYHVNDAIASGIHTADIDDEGVFQNSNNLTTANNYTYDAIGNLTQDKTEEILEIKWTVSGKIKKIIRTGISTKADLEYVYDAMGNRIAKILKPDGSSLENGGTDNPTLWTYTYYVRDAQGNIMANYQKSTASSITSFKLIERSIYGSSRLGIDKTTIDLTASITPPTILNYNLGLKNYELSNHLGNVMAVISDRKIPRSILGTNINFYMPDIVSATDYYPFGMTMQERTFNAGVEAYRFGFNGKENDAESNTQDYGMRIYDGRLGRFLSVDPLRVQYPELTPYQFASNSPIMGIDLDGEELLPVNSSMYLMKFKGYVTTTANKKFAYYDVIQQTENVPKDFHHAFDFTAAVGTEGHNVPSQLPCVFATPTKERITGLKQTDDMKPKNPARLQSDLDAGKENRVLTRVDNAGKTADFIVLMCDVALFLKDLDEKLAMGIEGVQRANFYKATMIIDSYNLYQDQKRVDLINYVLDGTLPICEIKNPTRMQANEHQKYKKTIEIEGQKILKENNIPIAPKTETPEIKYNVIVTETNK